MSAELTVKASSYNLGYPQPSLEYLIMTTPQIQPIIYCPLFLGAITVSGDNASKFLQGQLTCDVVKLTPGQSCLGAHCNPQGRVLSTFRLVRHHQDYLMLLPPSMVEPTLTNLSKYAAFSKVTLINSSDEYEFLGIVGLHCAELPTEIQHHADLVGTDLGGEPPRSILMGPADTIVTAITAFNQAGFLTLAAAIWHGLDIAATVPTIYPETQALFTPHDIDYPALGGVSFDKGCYTGQEIVARMQYRGKAKYGLYQGVIKTHAAVTVGDKLASDRDAPQQVGTIIDVLQTESGVYMILAVLLHEAVSQSIYRSVSGEPVRIKQKKSENC